MEKAGLDFSNQTKTSRIHICPEIPRTPRGSLFEKSIILRESRKRRGAAVMRPPCLRTDPGHAWRREPALSNKTITVKLFGQSGRHSLNNLTHARCRAIKRGGLSRFCFL